MGASGIFKVYSLQRVSNLSRQRRHVPGRECGTLVSLLPGRYSKQFALPCTTATSQSSLGIQGKLESCGLCRWCSVWWLWRCKVTCPGCSQGKQLFTSSVVSSLTLNSLVTPVSWDAIGLFLHMAGGMHCPISMIITNKS